jgi:hypothetical protein
MSEEKKKKPKVTVEVYEVFPVRKSDCAPGQLSLDEVRKYLSSKPYRRPDPPKK